MAFVCVRRSTDLIHSDRFEREKVPRRVMVLPDKALTKTAAEAVGLPPEEAGGGQSASAQHDTVSFDAFLRQVVLWALWLWVGAVIGTVAPF